MRKVCMQRAKLCVRRLWGLAVSGQAVGGSGGRAGAGGGALLTLLDCLLLLQAQPEFMLG